MSVPNLLGDWQVGYFDLQWQADFPDVFGERATFLTQDTSPIMSSGMVALSAFTLDVHGGVRPMVGLLNAQYDDVFVQLFFAVDREAVFPIDAVGFIEAQFFAESPVVYFIEQRRVEDRGYEQIKGTMRVVTKTKFEDGSWYVESEHRNIVFRRRAAPHGVITARR